MLKSLRSLAKRWRVGSAESSSERMRVGSRLRTFGVECLEERYVPASTAQLLSEFYPGTGSSYPRSYADLGNRTFFVAGDSFAQGDKGGLYFTDGTAAGIKRVEPAGRKFTDVSNLAAMGSYVYFAAKDLLPNGGSENGIELWRSDGTTLGTTLVKDIATGAGDSKPQDLNTVGNKIFFSVTNQYNNQDTSLWMTDGTTAGTKLVKDINPNGSDSVYIPSNYGSEAVSGNLLYFRAAISNQTTDYQLYRTDGTDAGTFKITSDPNGMVFPHLTSFNGKMYWDGFGKINYTDGTVAGTGSYGAFVGNTSSLTNLGNKLAYLAAPLVQGGNYNILTTTGNNAGSLAVALDSSYRWYNTHIVAAGGKVMLLRDGGSAMQSDYGADVFSLDLAQGKFSLLKTITVEAKKTTVHSFAATNDKLYFFLQSTDQFNNWSNYKLMESDGTAAGTGAVTNAFSGLPAENSSDYGMHVTPTNDVLIGLYVQGSGMELYKIGSPVGAPAVKARTDIVGRYNEAGQWYVGVSDGTKFNTTYWGTWSPGVDWVDVQTGDFNGDGLKDIVGRYGAAGQWYVGLSNGSSYSTSLWGVWSPGITWSDVKVGDFNRDGRDDIVGRWKETGQWYVGLSTGTAFTTSYFAAWSPGVTWTDVAVGDFNGDGRSDIAGRWMEAGQWYVGLSNGAAFATSYFGAWSPGTWLDVKVADLNSDGRTDVVGRLASSGEWYAGISNGTAFNTALWGVWSVINWVDVSVGDFNGDGKPDIAGRWKETGQWYVSASTGSAFATSYYGAWSVGVTWADVKVGDFDGDGKSDLVGRYKETGQWYVGKSNGSSFTNSLWATWSNAVTWADCQAANQS